MYPAMRGNRAQGQGNDTLVNSAVQRQFDELRTAATREKPRYDTFDQLKNGRYERRYLRVDDEGQLLEYKGREQGTNRELWDAVPQEGRGSIQLLYYTPGGKVYDQEGKQLGWLPLSSTARNLGEGQFIHTYGTFRAMDGRTQMYSANTMSFADGRMAVMHIADPPGMERVYKPVTRKVLVDYRGGFMERQATAFELDYVPIGQKSQADQLTFSEDQIRRGRKEGNYYYLKVEGQEIIRFREERGKDGQLRLHPERMIHQTTNWYGEGKTPTHARVGWLADDQQIEVRYGNGERSGPSGNGPGPAGGPIVTHEGAQPATSAPIEPSARTPTITRQEPVTPVAPEPLPDMPLTLPSVPMERTRLARRTPEIERITIPDTPVRRTVAPIARAPMRPITEPITLPTTAEPVPEIQPIQVQISRIQEAPAPSLPSAIDPLEPRPEQTPVRQVQRSRINPERLKQPEPERITRMEVTPPQLPERQLPPIALPVVPEPKLPEPEPVQIAALPRMPIIEPEPALLPESNPEPIVEQMPEPPPVLQPLTVQQLFDHSLTLSVMDAAAQFTDFTRGLAQFGGQNQLVQPAYTATHNTHQQWFIDSSRYIAALKREQEQGNVGAQTITRAEELHKVVDKGYEIFRTIDVPANQRPKPLSEMANGDIAIASSWHSARELSEKLKPLFARYQGNEDQLFREFHETLRQQSGYQTNPHYESMLLRFWVYIGSGSQMLPPTQDLPPFGEQFPWDRGMKPQDGLPWAQQATPPQQPLMRPEKAQNPLLPPAEEQYIPNPVPGRRWQQGGPGVPAEIPGPVPQIT